MLSCLIHLLFSSDIVRVKATVTEHTKTAKVIVFKKKRRKNYKRKQGKESKLFMLVAHTRVHCQAGQ